MSPDLTALVLTLRPGEAATVPAHLGNAVYAQTLRWLGAHDRAIANAIHDDDGPTPLTCSGLIGARRTGRDAAHVTPDREYHLRLTGLTPDISALLAAWAASPPAQADLNGTAFTIESATCDPAEDGRAGTATYADLAAPYLLAREHAARRVTLRFLTPTSFRSGGMSLPIPLPHLVFGSLADRWNAYSSVGLSPDTRHFCRSEVAMNSFELQSRAMPGKGGSTLPGSVGHATYIALNNDQYWRGVLQILADFAFYSGVGYRTSVGLGQACRQAARATAGG
ncbi:MAG: CRISPR system precrRNA processing endoribonuclease RAMP protein Cas6 [Anaerolineales bacterium]